MAAIALLALLLLSKRSSASPVNQSNEYCKQITIPVVASAPSELYDIPRVDNNVEATAWAINADTRDSPMGPQRVLENTTTSGTYNIHAQLCIPKSTTKNILQIATHGIHYDSRYWDPRLYGGNQSYVEAALKAGYSILTYDRLGAGNSDIPDAYTGVQALLEVEILRQITLMARNGTLSNLAGKAQPTNNAVFKSLSVPSKVVHVSHSFGSALTSAFIAQYGDLTDGAIITGFILNQYIGKAGMTSFSAQYAGTSIPSFERPSGYIVSQKKGIHTIFFGGDIKTAFTQEQLDYGDSIKQPVPIGELASAYTIIGLPGPSLRAPVQYVLGEFDFYICGGDCKGVASPQLLTQTFPNATDLEVVIQPNTGHGLTLHNNATAGYQLSFDFLARNGL